MKTLSIRDLHVAIEHKLIIRGMDLEIEAGQIHVIMGPNGAGKSTLAKVLAGDPSYEVTAGSVLLDGEEMLGLDPEERAQKGLFVGFQYPTEIPGVSNRNFLFAACNAKRKAQEQTLLTEQEFEKLAVEKLILLGMNSDYLDRNVNEGFSGGEKKRNEILQMALLDPEFSVLDETDSGLDIDALRIVASGIKALMRPDQALLLITHYQRLLEYIKPDFVHVVLDGKIAISGGADLALKLEQHGYDWLTATV